MDDEFWPVSSVSWMIAPMASISSVGGELWSWLIFGGVGSDEMLACDGNGVATPSGRGEGDIAGSLRTNDNG